MWVSEFLPWSPSALLDNMFLTQLYFTTQRMLPMSFFPKSVSFIRFELLLGSYRALSRAPGNWLRPNRYGERWNTCCHILWALEDAWARVPSGLFRNIWISKMHMSLLFTYSAVLPTILPLTWGQKLHSQLRPFQKVESHSCLADYTSNTELHVCSWSLSCCTS